MRNLIKKTAFTVALAAIMASSLFALGAGTSSADFLKIGVGARPSAMGNAYTAIADDSNAAFWNPAGLTAIDKWDVTFMHLIWYANTNYDFLSLVFPVDAMTNIGFSLNGLWIPPFNSTIQYSGNPLESDSELTYEAAVTLSFARNFGNFYTADFTIGNISLGANMTLILRQLVGISVPAAFTVDIGAIANITEQVKLGLVAADIGTSTGGDQTPFNVRLGMSGDIPLSKQFGILLSADVSKPIDITNPDYNKWYLNVGAEMRIAGYVNIRGGYKLGYDDETFTVGGGITIPDIGLSADYAFVPHNELGMSHRISISGKFGQPVPRPQVGAPSPPQRVTAIAGDKVVSIGWDPNPEENISGYNIYYKEQSSSDYKRLNEKPVMQEAKFRAVLKNNITYNFAVTAMNNRSLESVRSDVVAAMPEKYVPRKPKKITGVFASVEGDNIVVNWNEAGEEYVAGYNLYYKKTGAKKYKKLNRKTLKETKATLAGLKSGVRYNFMVTAVAKDGLESDFSEVVNAEVEGKDYY